MQPFESRVIFVFFMLGIGFFAFWVRAFYLQVIEHSFYEKLGKKQYERTIKLLPKRTTIYDKKGRLLAASIKVPSVYATPEKVPFVLTTSRELNKTLGLPKKELEKKLRSQKSFVWIKRQITPKQAKAVEGLNLKGISFLQEYRRFYPYREIASQVIGFTGIDSQGLEGIEHYYNWFLKGQERSYLLHLDGTRQAIPSPRLENTSSKNLALHLTIDAAIQYVTEKALKRGVVKHDAKSGTAIVMNSQTGAILALANFPTFDPNHFSQFPRQNYLNNAVSGGYEPGSTWKLITLAAALQEGMVTPDESIYCENGKYSIGTSIIHDVSPYGNLKIQEILQKSSNICSSKIGLRLTSQKFYKYIRLFGFGEKTGVGLPGEATGKISSPKDWQMIDHAIISFGHGILVSPLQLLVAINAIANQGVLQPPFVVQNKDSHAELAKQFQQKPRRVISEQTAEILTQFMVSVTQKEGSGRRARVKGISVAGKTGTSELFDRKTGRYSKKRNIASFVGFLPAEAPQLSILVLIREPSGSSFGSVVAAPIFQEIARRSLAMLAMDSDRAN